ncbi:amino acid permease [uncultured Hoeflea sp.]|uniref:amino acid permease n=1 Tax=uncultured Hoeflea sp. TaxID=538666 RepID=UPI002617BE14|nr:amino acid permease [uncultured Hoeflea sp.]
MADTTSASRTSGKAALGLWMCTALVVGNMIGSGIFLLPSSLAAFGPISLVGWVVTAGGAIALALIFGRLAALTPKTGGPYAYAREGFGDFAGFLIAWGYWIALWSGNAAVAVAFAGYLSFLVPFIGGSQIAGLVAALGAIWLLTWMNIRGVQEAGVIQLVTTVMKLVPILLLIVFGVAYIDTANFTPVNVSGQSTISAISACAALTLWAFIGLESATVPAGDVVDPERTIPRATIIGTCLAAAVYIGVTVVALGVMPSAELAGTNAPLALVAGVMWGAGGATFIAIGACISTFGTLNGFTMLTGQVPLGAARDGIFPEPFARLSKTGTPAFGLVVSNVLASGLIMMNYSESLSEQFEFIILLATLSTLIPYLVCSLSELMISVATGREIATNQSLKVATLASVGFVYSIWAIYGAGRDVVFWGFLLLMTGLPIYVWLRWQASKSTSGETF